MLLSLVDVAYMVKLSGEVRHCEKSVQACCKQSVCWNLQATSIASERMFLFIQQQIQEFIIYIFTAMSISSKE